MQNRTITRVHDASGLQRSPFNEPLWFVEHDIEGGVPWTYIFPHSLLGWRAAEYEFNPEDIDTLIEVVLHEFHMTIETHNHNHSTHVWKADPKTAREALLGRITEVKGRVTHHDPNNQLDVIRKAWNPFHPALRVQRDHVRAIREQKVR